jgi:hypothetical protein
MAQSSGRKAPPSITASPVMPTGAGEGIPEPDFERVRADRRYDDILVRFNSREGTVR